MHDISAVLKNNVVLLVALAAAAITCFFVPPDGAYAEYFDMRTLSCLFCTMAVVAALKNVKFFTFTADRIVRKFKNTRNVVLALVFVTYVGSMVMANDMALITFLPLGYFALGGCGQKKLMAFTFVMQNVAANLGGMLTPFGNPQNLYLYSYYSIPAAEFFAIMAVPFLTAFALIAGVCFFVKKEPAEIVAAAPSAPSAWRTAVYFALFALSVMIVFRVFPYYWGAAAVVASLIFLDYKAFAKVDYALLLTFCAFFVFSGNMARIPAVREFFSFLMGRSTLFFGVLSCQVISNVPSAVLLSKFTSDYASLLVAVNIGGLGTPVASLASLITLSNFRQTGGSVKRYLGLFFLINVSFLAVLLAVSVLI
ncbi:MAG: citrate transporter [Bacillota bacterium]|nr:MAG: citrate transporter [Bacillota bacterium]